MITKERKHTIVAKFGVTPRDTGRPAVQIALLTERINGLMDHFRKSPKDHASRRGLLAHLRDNEPKRYVDILKELNLRK